MGKKTRGMVSRMVKRMFRDTVQIKKDVVNELVRKVEKYQRRKSKYLSEDQKNEISKIHIQNTLAKKGAEEEYVITRLELMERYLEEEIEVYEQDPHSGSVENAEQGTERRAEPLAPVEAGKSEEHREC